MVSNFFQESQFLEATYLEINLSPGGQVLQEITNRSSIT